jgi:hypothetical protein
MIPLTCAGVHPAPANAMVMRWYGDVVVGNTLAAAHDAVADDWPHVRTIERIALEGEPIT